MNREKLCTAVYRTAIAFGILHLDINLGRLNILPDWLGYWMILNSLDALSEEEPSAQLLRPLGSLLMWWKGVLWVFALLGSEPRTDGALNYIFYVVQIYFQFQLMTNLAHIAERYVPRFAPRILRLRSVMTVVSTAAVLVLAVDVDKAVITAAAVVQMVSAVWLFKTLLNMENALSLTLLGRERSQREPTFSEQLKQ